MKILAVQNRMGIGDTVIFLPFIKALSKKYNSPISILVKENTKADQFLHETNYIDKILLLERDRNNNNHGGFFGTFRLVNYITKTVNFFHLIKNVINFFLKVFETFIKIFNKIVYIIFNIFF